MATVNAVNIYINMNLNREENHLNLLNFHFAILCNC